MFYHLFPDSSKQVLCGELVGPYGLGDEEMFPLSKTLFFWPMRIAKEEAIKPIVRALLSTGALPGFKTLSDPPMNWLR